MSEHEDDEVSDQVDIRRFPDRRSRHTDLRQDKGDKVR